MKLKEKKKSNNFILNHKLTNTIHPIHWIKIFNNSSDTYTFSYGKDEESTNFSLN